MRDHVRMWSMHRSGLIWDTRRRHHWNSPRRACLRHGHYVLSLSGKRGRTGSCKRECFRGRYDNLWYTGWCCREASRHVLLETMLNKIKKTVIMQNPTYPSISRHIQSLRHNNRPKFCRLSFKCRNSGSCWSLWHHMPPSNVSADHLPEYLYNKQISNQ